MALSPVPGITLSGVQVSLQNLIKLLQIKGRNPGFDLSSAVVPIVDISRLIELEYGAPLAPDQFGDEYVCMVVSANGSVGPPVVPNIVQIFNPASSPVNLEVTAFVADYFSATTLQVGVRSAPCNTDRSASIVNASRGSVGGGYGQVRENTDATGAVPARDGVLTSYEGAQRAVLNHMLGRRWTLPPGKGYDLHITGQAGAAGTQFIANFYWRELQR